MPREPHTRDWPVDALKAAGSPLVRLLVDGEARWGAVDGDEVLLCDAGASAPHPVGDGAERVDRAGAVFLPPTRPSKIVCVGLNYADHCAEMGESPEQVEITLFLKPPSALVGHGEAVVFPTESSRVDHEAELAAVIGARLSHATPEECEAGVLGWTCANDVTARDIQKGEKQWARGKGFDTFCPLGPWVVPGLDVSSLAVSCTVDGQVRQSGRTCEMIHRPYELVSFISRSMTLEPGDVVLTGTPSGIGPLQPGQTVEVSIEGIGTLANPVVSG